MIRRLFSSALFRSAGVYTLSNVVNSAVPFLLLPVFTRYLSPTDYGIVSMFQVMTGIMTPIIGLSIHGAIGRQYVEKSREELAEYVGNCLLLALLSFCLAGAAFLLFGTQIAALSSIDREWLWTAVVFVLGQVFVQVLLVLWQMQSKARQYAVLSLLQTSLNATLSLSAIVLLGMGWKGRIGAQVVTSLLFALIAITILARQGWIRPRYNRAYMISALSFGLPLIPHALSSWATDMIDRVFVTNLVGIVDTGIYSVGYQIGMIISILEASFIQAWVPHLYRDLKENTPAIRMKLVKLTYAYCLGLVCLAVLLTLAAKFLMPYLVGTEFQVAQRYVIWIALGYAFNGMYKMMAGYFFYFEKTRVLAVITTVSALINVSLTYVCVNRYQTIGAAYSTTLSYLVTFLMTWLLVDRVNRMPWLLRKRG